MILYSGAANEELLRLNPATATNVTNGARPGTPTSVVFPVERTRRDNGKQLLCPARSLNEREHMMNRKEPPW